MSQKSRAIADVSVSGWTPTPVTPRINEASPDGAASYVTNGGINPSGDTFEVKLAALARPEAGSQVLTINLQKTDSGSAPVTVALLQGATVIGEWPVTPTTSFADHCLTLTDTQVAAITDYSNLRVQVTAGGSPSSSSSSSSSESGVVTSCCPDNEIPGTLYATVSGSESCSCFNTSVRIPLTWNGSAWTGSGSMGTCGHTLSLVLECFEDGLWFCIVDTSPECMTGTLTGFASSCDPFSINFTFAGSLTCCAGSGPLSLPISIATD